MLRRSVLLTGLAVLLAGAPAAHAAALKASEWNASLTIHVQHDFQRHVTEEGRSEDESAAGGMWLHGAGGRVLLPQRTGARHWAFGGSLGVLPREEPAVEKVRIHEGWRTLDRSCTGATYMGGKGQGENQALLRHFSGRLRVEIPGLIQHIGTCNTRRTPWERFVHDGLSDFEIVFDVPPGIERMGGTVLESDYWTWRSPCDGAPMMEQEGYGASAPGPADVAEPGGRHCRGSETVKVRGTMILTRRCTGTLRTRGSSSAGLKCRRRR